MWEVGGGCAEVGGPGSVCTAAVRLVPLTPLFLHPNSTIKNNSPQFLHLCLTP